MKREEIAVSEVTIVQDAIRQVDLVFEHSTKAARIKTKIDLKKQEIKQARAQTASYIRENPKEYDLTKPTDKAVEECIALDDELQQLDVELIELQKLYAREQAYLTSLDHRRSMIKTIVEVVSAQNMSHHNRHIEEYERKKANG